MMTISTDQLQALDHGARHVVLTDVSMNAGAVVVVPDDVAGSMAAIAERTLYG